MGQPGRSDGRPHIVLTPGEPAGIGPDIALAIAAGDLPIRLTCIADPELMRSRARLLGLPYPFAFPEAAPLASLRASGTPTLLPIPLVVDAIPGALDARNGPYVLACLDRAIAGCLSGEFDALVTGPVHKGIINEAGISFTGHTEYLALRSGNAVPVMMLVTGDLRVALVTTHLPLRAVPDAITRELVLYVLRTVATALKQRFDIARPRILVCGLNPHAGEGGYLGREDEDVIAPAIAVARQAGLAVRGPLPADTAFTPRLRAKTDAYVAMYHDQGLPVLKAIGFGEAVNVTLGLPLIRTSVDHGTALDLAGSGRADTGSLRAAIELAAAFVHARGRAGA